MISAILTGVGLSSGQTVLRLKASLYAWLFGPQLDIFKEIAKAIVDLLLEPLKWLLAQFVVNVFFYPVAWLLWKIDTLLIFIGVLTAKMTEILMDTVFRTGFELLADRLRVNLLPFVFTLVVIILGITYVMSAFWFRETQLVDWKKAVAWLLAALIFYTAGVDLFIGSDQLRRGLAAIMYETILSAENGTADIPRASEVYGPLALGDVGDFDVTGPVRDYFGPGQANWLENDVGLDGLDITMAFLLADVDDLSGSGLPDDFEDTFFDGSGDSDTLIEKAINGVQRMFFGIFIAVFAIIEQWIFLLIAVAMGIVFFMMLWAILLAFFNQTEYIARSIAKMWFNMMMVALFASVIQATALFLLLISVTAANPIIWIAAALIALLMVLFSEQSVRGAVKDMIKSIPQTAQGAIRGGFMMPMGGGGGGGGGMGMGMGGMNPASMAQMAAMATPQGRAASMAGGMGGMKGGMGGMKGGMGGMMSPQAGMSGLMGGGSKIGPSGLPQMGGGGGKPGGGMPKPSSAFGPQSVWQSATPSALAEWGEETLRW